MPESWQKCDKLLISLRKIIRAIDLHSKELAKKFGLTGPQMVVLKSISSASNPSLNSSQIAKDVSLSQATVTSILDRLTENNYITRHKSQTDKRQVHVRLTDKAITVFAQNPTLLQENFIKQFEALKEWEQDLLCSSLARIAEMMDAKSIEAAPILVNTENIEDINSDSE